MTFAFDRVNVAQWCRNSAQPSVETMGKMVKPKTVTRKKTAVKPRGSRLKKSDVAMLTADAGQERMDMDDGVGAASDAGTTGTKKKSRGVAKAKRKVKRKLGKDKVAGTSRRQTRKGVNRKKK